MPELAEVEVVRRNLSTWWMSASTEVIVHDPDVLHGASTEQLIDTLRQSPSQFVRRGKYLICLFDAHEPWLVFHFRMTGKIVLSDDPSPRFARLSWCLAPHQWLVFKDPRRLGSVQWHGAGPWSDDDVFQRMGPEPESWTVDDLQALSSSKALLKSKLLDQQVVAGIGNIAICELFWRLRFPPKIRCQALSLSQMHALIEETNRYFEWLIDDQQSPEIIYLQEGKGEHPFDVYGRENEPCKRCQAPIERMTVSGRSSYFCPICQAESDVA